MSVVGAAVRSVAVPQSISNHNNKFWHVALLCHWAAMQAYHNLQDRPVGVFPLEVPITSSWFPPTSTLGLGGILCIDLAEDVHRQVYGSQGTNKNGTEMDKDAKLPDSEINILMTVLIGRRCRSEELKESLHSKTH